MNNDSRTQNTIKNIIAGFAGQGILLIIGFANRMVFVRYLSEEYLGVNGLFISIISALGLAELGIGSAIGYELYQCLVKKDEGLLAAYIRWYGRAYKIIACFITITGIMIIPLLPELTKSATGIKEDITLIYLLYLSNTVVSYFFSYKTSIVYADQKDYKLKKIDICVKTVTEIIRMLVLVCTHSFIGYLICNTIGTLVGGYLGARLACKNYPFIKSKNCSKLSREQIKRLLINIKALVVSRVGSYLVNGTDNIIISLLNGLNVNGIISNFTLLTSTLNNIVFQLVQGVSASVGNLNAAESKEKSLSIFWQMNLVCFWFYGWSAVSFIILANDIVGILFGSQYVLSIWAIVILALNYYTAGVMNAAWTFKNAMGLFRYGQYLVFAMGIINIALSVGLGRTIGLCGVLIATTISRLSTDYWYTPYALFKHGFGKPFKQYAVKWIWQIVCIVCTVLVLNIISNLTNGLSFFISFFLKLLLCIILPHLIFTLFWFRSDEFKAVVKRVITILRIKTIK